MPSLEDINFEEWDYTQLSNYCKTSDHTIRIDHKGRRRFEGFMYFTPRSADLITRGKVYSNTSLRSPLEHQDKTDVPNQEFTQAIVALDDENVVGLGLFDWVDTGNDFWHYFNRWFDVHEGYTKIGVATELAKRTNSASFLEGHILQLSVVGTKAPKKFTQMLNRNLTGETYALLPREYPWTIPPTEPGIYTGDISEPHIRAYMKSESS